MKVRYLGKNDPLEVLSGKTSDIIVDEFGTLEEFGLLSVGESSGEMLSIPEVGADTTTFEVNETIVAMRGPRSF